MLRHVHYEELGRANYGWLNARHHFSFANYYNPQRMGFGTLLVVNDDLISGQSGFPLHGHRDMEIITYVRRGAISHKDSEGNEGITLAGNVQVMSAGKGIKHSEWNSADEETSLYQIWIHPREKGVTPRWDAAEFPQEPVKDQLNLLVSGDGSAPLMIHQDAKIFAGQLLKGTELKHQLEKLGYLLVSQGRVTVQQGENVVALKKGDACEIGFGETFSILSTTDAEILVLDIPNA